MNRPRNCPLCGAKFCLRLNLGALGGGVWVADVPNGSMCSNLEQSHVVLDISDHVANWDSGDYMVDLLRDESDKISERIRYVMRWGDYYE